jgi:hypothetical protein
MWFVWGVDGVKQLRAPKKRQILLAVTTFEAHLRTLHAKVFGQVLGLPSSLTKVPAPRY